MAQVKQCCLGCFREFKKYVTLITDNFLVFIQFFCYSFASRGQVLDLAIGMIIGTAFTNVIQSLVDDIITPPLGFVLGGVDFANLTIRMTNFVHKDQPPVVIRYGAFIQTIITLFIVAFVLFFIVRGINQLYKIAMRKQQTAEIQMTEEVKVLCEIRDLLSAKSIADSKSIRL